jgi:hypothetical protein
MSIENIVIEKKTNPASHLKKKSQSEEEETSVARKKGMARERSQESVTAKVDEECKQVQITLHHYHISFHLYKLKGLCIISIAFSKHPFDTPVILQNIAVLAIPELCECNYIPLYTFGHKMTLRSTRLGNLASDSQVVLGARTLL